MKFGKTFFLGLSVLVLMSSCLQLVQSQEEDELDFENEDAMIDEDMDMEEEAPKTEEKPRVWANVVVDHISCPTEHNINFEVACINARKID